jgi:hypothetical protein
MSLELGPLSFESTIEELLERKSSFFDIKIEITAIGIHTTRSAKKFALPTSGGR